MSSRNSSQSKRGEGERSPLPVTWSHTGRPHSEAIGLSAEKAFVCMRPPDEKQRKRQFVFLIKIWSKVKEAERLHILSLYLLQRVCLNILRTNPPQVRDVQKGRREHSNCNPAEREWWVHCASIFAVDTGCPYWQASSFLKGSDWETAASVTWIPEILGPLVSLSLQFRTCGCCWVHVYEPLSLWDLSQVGLVACGTLWGGLLSSAEKEAEILS